MEVEPDVARGWRLWMSVGPVCARGTTRGDWRCAGRGNCPSPGARASQPRASTRFVKLERPPRMVVRIGGNPSHLRMPLQPPSHRRVPEGLAFLTTENPKAGRLFGTPRHVDDDIAFDLTGMARSESTSSTCPTAFSVMPAVRDTAVSCTDRHDRERCRPSRHRTERIAILRHLLAGRLLRAVRRRQPHALASVDHRFRLPVNQFVALVTEGVGQSDHGTVEGEMPEGAVRFSRTPVWRTATAPTNGPGRLWTSHWSGISPVNSGSTVSRIQLSSACDSSALTSFRAGSSAQSYQSLGSCWQSYSSISLRGTCRSAELGHGLGCPGALARHTEFTTSL